MTTDLRFRNAGAGRKTVIFLLEILLAVYVLFIFYPLANMVLSSFRTTREILRTPFALPVHLDFKNYVTVWVGKGFGRYFANSLWITAASMVRARPLAWRGKTPTWTLMPLATASSWASPTEANSGSVKTAMGRAL